MAEFDKATIEKNTQAISNLIQAIDKLNTVVGNISSFTSAAGNASASRGKGKKGKKSKQSAANTYSQQGQSALPPNTNTQVTAAAQNASASLQNLASSSTDVQKASAVLTGTIRSIDKSYGYTYGSMDKFNMSLKASSATQASVLSDVLEGRGMENDVFDKFSEKVLATANSLSSFQHYVPNGVNSIHEMIEALGKMGKSAEIFEKHLGNKTLMPIDKFVESLLAMEASGQDLSDAQKEMLQHVRDANLIDSQGRVKDTAAFEAHVKSVKQDIIAQQKSAQKFVMLHEAMESVKEKFGFLGKAVSLLNNPLGLFSLGLSVFVSSLSDSLKQFTMMTAAGLGDNFSTVKGNQLALGISLETMTKVYQESGRIIAGANGSLSTFTEGLKANQHTMMAMGLTTDEATEATAEFIKNAAKSGIDVTDSLKQRKAVIAQTDAFKKLKASTKISIGEFKTFQEEMLNSEAVQKQLNSVSEDQRTKQMQDMMELRQTFVNLGMGAQNAQKALMSVQEYKKEKVGNRWKDAAQVAAMMGRLNIGGGDQIAHLIRTGQTNDPRVIKALQAIRKSNDELKSQGLKAEETGGGMENIADVNEGLIDSLSPALKAMADTARSVSLEQPSNKELTGDQVNALAEAQASETVATANQIQSIATNFVSDPIVKALLGLGIMLMPLIPLVSSIAATVAGKGLSGLKDDAIDGVKKLGSTAAGNLSKAGWLKGGGLALGTVGAMAIGADFMSQSSQDQEEKKQAKAEGKDISERTAWNDWGVLASKVGLRNLIPDSLTELDEYDVSGKRLRDKPVIPETKPEVIPVTKPEVTPVTKPEVIPVTKLDTAFAQPVVEAKQDVAPTALKTPGVVNPTTVNTSTAGEGKATAQNNATVVQLSEETLKILLAKLDEIYKQDASALTVEQQQLEALNKMTQSNDDIKTNFEDILNKRPITDLKSGQYTFFQKH